MEYQIKLKPKVEKELNKIPKNNYFRIILALKKLVENPYIGKKLEGELKMQWSYRVWPFRIIYMIEKKELMILVIKIGHRQGVYK